MRSTSAAPRAPYKLFDYYDIEDSDLFFGREAEVLRTVGEVLSTRLLVLFAPSGSGKSSLINAGVRPRLEERGFATCTVRLDRRPDLAVKKRLRDQFPQVFGHLTDETDLADGLRAAYAPKDDQPTPKPLVIFLDQFEEFFIVWRDQPAVRRAFIQQVAEIKFDTSLPVYLVLSLREDYFVNLNEFREEIPSVFHNNANIQLRPLDDDAAFRAIVEPARKCGLDFEPGLPELIIRDLRQLQTGTAPAVSLAPPRGESQGEGAPDQSASEAAFEPHDGSERALTGPVVSLSPPGGEGRGEGAPGQSARAELDSGNAPSGEPATALPESNDVGVLPITLQIVCHTLWAKRPADGGPITRQLYAGSKAEGGLGGAAAIIRRQLDESLRKIPRSKYGLMRKLFRVLMTADLTKRLRSVDDLAGILRLRDREKLKQLLKKLTEVSVLHEEHSERQPWYEFRHDYLVKEVAAWLERIETRLRRRRQACAWGLGVAPALAFLLYGLWMFLSVEVRFAPKQYEEQEEELYITRRFNPFSFHVTTGFRKDEVTDLQHRNAIIKGYPLRFARTKDWRPLTNLIAAEALGRLLSEGLADQSGLRFLLIENFQRCVHLAKAQPSCLRTLKALLKDSEWQVRQNAAAALVELGQEGAPSVERLLALLEESKPLVRQNAVAALVPLGHGNPQVVKKLLALLKDGSAYVRQSAATALGQLAKRDALVVDALLALLNDGDSGVRLSAAAALGQLGQGDPPVINGLLGLLKNSDSSIRGVAAMALGQLGQGDPPVINGLLALLKDGDPFVRTHAAEALGRLGKADAPVIDGLLALLADSGWGVRWGAAAALGQLGQGKPSVGEHLLALIEDRDPNVSERAAEALGQLGAVDAAVVNGLLTLIKSRYDYVRRGAAVALGHLGRGDPAVAEGLLPLLKDRESAVRLGAAAALVQLGWGDAPVVEGLLALLKDDGFYVRRDATAVLGQLGKAEAPVVQGLVALLKDSYPDVRQSAAAALGKLGQKRDDWTDARLLRMLQDNLSGWRKTAGMVLAYREKLDQTTYEKVRALRQDKRPWVRMAAWDALIEIQKVRDAREEEAKAKARKSPDVK